ncbi:antileukoproteinase-like [Mytilus edulis]|uniref:antileukoproteinase-like n=1 Tax=Mytilus edulis TaxID=6550 RepID=UPI0039EE67F7
MWQAGILILYLIHHAHTTWTTHSRCPALNQSVRCKSYPKFDQCQTDTNCPGGKICCPQKCGKECITPSLPIGNRPGCPVCLGTQAGTECSLCAHFQNLCNADTECKAGVLFLILPL